MTSQSLPVSGTTSIALADELGQRFPSLGNEAKCLEVSRVFVDKVVEAARSMVTTRFEKSGEMVRLAYHIEATQENLEKLYDNGLGSTEASHNLFATIVDMAQKFHSCHREMFQEISKQALSEER